MTVQTWVLLEYCAGQTLTQRLPLLQKETRVREALLQLSDIENELRRWPQMGPYESIQRGRYHPKIAKGLLQISIQCGCRKRNGYNTKAIPIPVFNQNGWTVCRVKRTGCCGQ
jgi:hypothetical protein